MLYIPQSGLKHCWDHPKEAPPFVAPVLANISRWNIINALVVARHKCMGLVKARNLSSEAIKRFKREECQLDWRDCDDVNRLWCVRGNLRAEFDVTDDVSTLTWPRVRHRGGCVWCVRIFSGLLATKAWNLVAQRWFRNYGNAWSAIQRAKIHSDWQTKYSPPCLFNIIRGLFHSYSFALESSANNLKSSARNKKSLHKRPRTKFNISLNNEL